jgi:hypothetical protein
MDCVGIMIIINLRLHRPSTNSYVNSTIEEETQEIISAQEYHDFYDALLARTDPLWKVDFVFVRKKD